MTAALVVLLPAAAGGYAMAIARSLVTMNVALAAVALCVAGALVRKYVLIVCGTWLVVLNYVGALLSVGRPVQVWPALLMGIAAFVLLEVGHDWVHTFRAVVGVRTYRLRALWMVRTSLIATGGVFAFATLALNAREHLGLRIELHILALVALVAVCSVAAPILYLVRREAAREEGKEGT